MVYSNMQYKSRYLQFRESSISNSDKQKYISLMYAIDV